MPRLREFGGSLPPLVTSSHTWRFAEPAEPLRLVYKDQGIAPGCHMIAPLGQRETPISSPSLERQMVST